MGDENAAYSDNVNYHDGPRHLMVVKRSKLRIIIVSIPPYVTPTTGPTREVLHDSHYVRKDSGQRGVSKKQSGGVA